MDNTVSTVLLFALLWFNIHLIFLYRKLLHKDSAFTLNWEEQKLQL